MKGKIERRHGVAFSASAAWRRDGVMKIGVKRRNAWRAARKEKRRNNNKCVKWTDDGGAAISAQASAALAQLALAQQCSIHGALARAGGRWQAWLAIPYIISASSSIINNPNQMKNGNVIIGNGKA